MAISAIVPGLEVAQVKGRHLVEVVSLAFEVPVPLLFIHADPLLVNPPIPNGQESETGNIVGFLIVKPKAETLLETRSITVLVSDLGSGLEPGWFRGLGLSL